MADFPAPVGRTINHLKSFLDAVGNAEAVVHVGRLLEFSLADEAIGVVSRTSSPSNLIVGVEFNTGLSLFGGDDLETIVVDEDIGGSSLKFICGNGLLD